MLKRLGMVTIFLVIVVILLGIFHKPILKQIYKVEYKEVIDKYSEEYNVDRILMYSLIKKESKYDPLAISKKGAIGLTQVMPETGEYIAKLLKDDDYNENSLFDAETNIKYGSFYLAKLDKDFNGDLEAVIASYNGGEGNVRKWMSENNGHLDEEKIPFKQTKDYVKIIKRDYKIYDYLYGNE